MDDKVQNVAIGCDERKREMMFAAMMHEKIAEKRGRQVAPRYHKTERKKAICLRCCSHRDGGSMTCD